MIVGGPSATRSAVAAKPARVVRASTAFAVSSIARFCAETVGSRMSAASSSTYSCWCARTCASKAANRSGTRRTISLIRDGREARLALAELAARRERRDLDPPLLAEVVDDAVRVLEGLALVDLRARDHEPAVAAIDRECRAWPARAAKRGEREDERGGGEQREDREKDDDPHLGTVPPRR